MAEVSCMMEEVTLGEYCVESFEGSGVFDRQQPTSASWDFR